MHRLNAALGIALFATSCASFTQHRGVQMGDIKLPLRDLRYASGLRVIVEEDHSSHRVAIANVVGVGSANEPPGKEGMAHLIEHLAFRARHDGKTKMWSMLENAGAGGINAFTAFDETLYHEVCATEAFPALLKLEATRMAYPVENIDDNTFAVEREVVRNELRQRGENSVVSGDLLAKLQLALYPADHPYVHPVVGSHESLLSVTPKDVQAFVDQYYRPDNMTLVISGDVDLATVDQLVLASLPQVLLAPSPGARRPGPPRLSAEIPEPPAPPPGAPVNAEAEVPTPEVLIGWSLPRGYDANALLDFVTEAFNGATAIATRVDPDVTGVQAFTIPGTRGAMLVCLVILREGTDPAKSAERVLNQVFRLWSSERGVEYDEYGIPIEESAGTQSAREEAMFGRRKSEAFVDLAFLADDLPQRAMERATATHFTGDPTMVTRNMRSLAALERERVSEFAYKYLVRDRARMVFVKPMSAEARAKSGPASLALSAAVDDEGDKVITLADVERQAQHPGLSDFRSEWLPNGMEVIVGRRASLPLAAVGLSVGGGSAMAVPAAAARWAQYLAQPHSHRNGDPGEMGAQLEHRVERDAVVWTGHAAAGNLPEVLAILSDRVRSMRVNEAGYAGLSRDALPYLQRSEQHIETRARRAFLKALYGDHPYSTQATAEQMSKVSVGQVQDWVDQQYRPQNATLAIVGDVDVDQTLAEVKKYFADWQRSGSEKPNPLPPPLPAPAPEAARVVVTHRAAATQAELEIGCALQAGVTNDDVTHALMASMVTHYVNKEARQKMGGTYGLHMGSRGLRGGVSEVVMGGLVDNAHLEPVLTLIHNYFEQRAEKPASEEELNRGRWDIVVNRVMADASDESLVGRALTTRLRGWTLQEVDDFPKQLVNVTAAQVQDAFKACRDRMAVSIVGDEPTVRAALKQWGTAQASAK